MKTSYHTTGNNNSSLLNPNTMKKLLFILIVFASCQKTDTAPAERPQIAVNLQNDELYGYGNETYKGKPPVNPCGNRGKNCPPTTPPDTTVTNPPAPPDTTPPPTNPPTNPPAKGDFVALIDTDGHNYTGAYWTNMFFGEADASLNVAEVLEILRIQYQDYRISFTTSEYVFSQADVNNRIRVVLTSSRDRTGSGYAFVGSGFWGPEAGQTEAPMALVYSSNLQNYSFYVGEIASHELGHTLNLTHVHIWNADCSVNQTYLGGYVMGNGTYGGDSQWHPGHPCRWQGGAYGRSDDAVLTEGIGRR